MIFGVAKEIKDHETRVGLLPSDAKELIDLGSKVIVETGAGAL
ncbi:MAG: alanine dehydrogenase, partial [Ruminococcaceae bacterium]|nr:alanine dehydrogenase [Oscillospiraceae bacterium]MBE6990213.1 alanine dehydrogenase [Oscillospiraceae bacterium]